MTLLDPATDTAVDFKRDRWGRPLIVPRRGGGKPKPYTRASSAAKTIEDTFNLELWARRNVAYGMAHDASLVARVLAVGGNPGDWSKDQKAEINAVHEDAQKVAQAHKAADIGTALHKLTERLDRGEQVDGGPYQADLDAYAAAMDAAGLERIPEFVECRMVCDELEMAGTADRIVRLRRPQHGGSIGTPRHAIADLKTGPTVEYGGLGWAAQLAAYANSDLYDPTDDSRPETPDIETAVGYIIHLPAGQGRCALYEVDLVKGFAAAELANQIRQVRKDSKKWITVLDTAGAPLAGVSTSPAPPPSGAGDHLAVDDALPSSSGDAPPTPVRAAGVGGEQRKRDLVKRYRNLGESEQAEYTRRKADIDTADLDAVERLLDEVDGFANRTPPAPVEVKPAVAKPVTLADLDQGKKLPDGDFRYMREAVANLPKPQHTWLRIVLDSARAAGVEITAGWERSFDLLRGLLFLARNDGDDEMVRTLAATALGDDAPFFAATAGHAVGILDAAAASTFAELCLAVYGDAGAVELRPFQGE